MKLTLGFSPCPNDTYIFDALIHHKIDTEGLDFEVSYQDVETLNQKAFAGEMDITKLSYHAYAYAVEQYVLLDAGSALGFGVGPLLISKDEGLARELSVLLDTSSVLTDTAPPLIDPSVLRVGIPGVYTTANFLLGLAFPTLINKKNMVFSAIESALLDGDIDLGLIIHENRFTYQQKGLHKVADLGDFWENTTGSPIPLGGIVAKRSLSPEILHKINRVLRRSVQFAFDHPESGIDFIRSHAQAMDTAVMYQHIELYVNQYSLDLGEKGRQAIQELFTRANRLGTIPAQGSVPLFLS